MTSKLAKVVYVVFGAGAILYGLANLLAPSALHFAEAQSFPLMHNLREQGAAFIFLGLMSLWCSFNYERSRTIHHFLTLFNLFIAGIHWNDYFKGYLPIGSPLFNSIAFVVFAALAIGRYREPLESSKTV
ncbi:MAG TPA: hypothetical protein VLA93_06765 [Pyrinomonadaceae bacterium]|nr:hypothetical protein [Pyrinomonadaceae bacterium]